MTGLTTYLQHQNVPSFNRSVKKGILKDLESCTLQQKKVHLLQNVTSITYSVHFLFLIVFFLFPHSISLLMLVVVIKKIGLDQHEHITQLFWL